MDKDDNSYQQVDHPRCQSCETFKSVLEITKQSHENFDAGMKRILLEPASMADCSEVALHYLCIHYNAHNNELLNQRPWRIAVRWPCIIFASTTTHTTTSF